MSSFFVSGTDTDVGKTVVSALLTHALSKYTKVCYFKPVQSGAPTDSDQVDVFLNKSVEVRPSTYRLKTPMSPDRAAELEGVTICLDKIKEDFCGRQEALQVVEGAGGLLVPLNQEEKMVDLAATLKTPIVLVASSRLGTINHTLLSLEAIRSRGLQCHGVVLNGEKDPGLKELLQKQGHVRVLFELPKLESLDVDSFDAEIARNSDLRETIDLLLQQNLAFDVCERKSLKERDSQYVWHPFTQHGIVKTHPLVAKAQGSYLYLQQNKVIDAISSWWVNLFGHCHPDLVQAAHEQAQNLEHVLFAGFTHEPAIELAEHLLNLTKKAGAKLDKVFYSDNGSTSIEVALKLAWQYHQQAKENSSHKSKVLALSGAYHGDTIGAMSMGERKGFNEVFKPLMFDVDYVDPFDVEALEEHLKQNGSSYFAVIVEPMVQGASGMRMYPAEFLNTIERLKSKYGFLVICDEVFTGFYRTGRMFAFEHSDLKPDLLCLSKGITGGFLPLAATLVTEELYQAFHNEDMRKAFLHGHSYTANPIACRVAVKTMELLQSEYWEKAVDNIVHWTGEALEQLKSEAPVYNVRQLGTIGAMEVSGEDPNYFKGDYSYRFSRAAMKKGLLLRPLGGTIYAVPPYCCSQTDIQKIYQGIANILKEEV